LARIAGVVGLVLTGAALAWLTTDPAFSISPDDVIMSGLHYTDPAAVRRQMRLVGDIHPATVIISTRSLEAAVEQLPTVLHARVRATLPDQLTVTVTEREPMLEWTAGGQAWLMDVEGLMFAPATAPDTGDGSTETQLPVIDDQRRTVALGLGDRLGPVDLEAVRTLGSVTPELLHSDATTLQLSLDDDDGWVLSAPGHWRAVFGHYTQTLAPPSRIPTQVQCLRSLLQASEPLIDGVTLAVGSDRLCGTYRPGTPEPRPRATKRPRRTASP
jgi:hypothetical protein